MRRAQTWTNEKPASRDGMNSALHACVGDDLTPLKMLESELHRMDHVCNMRSGPEAKPSSNKIKVLGTRADVVKLVDTQDLKS